MRSTSDSKPSVSTTRRAKLCPRGTHDGFLRSIFGGALGALLVVSFGCTTPLNSSRSTIAATHHAAIFGVLDQYMEALNALDFESHASTYHFPHYRHAGGKVVIWESAEEALPILQVPKADRRKAVRAALEPEWSRSEWTRREIVQGDAEKVHVATRFVRLREDGTVIKTFDSLYVMTFEAGRWAIKGRSSFAP